MKIGDKVRVWNGDGIPPSTGIIADIMLHYFFMTLLIKVGEKAGRPLLIWADARNVRKV